MGVDDSQMGPVPFAVAVSVEGEAPEGPVDLNETPSNVADALLAARQNIKGELTKGRIKLIAESLVLRARQGDQNAMAMMAAVRTNAAKGNERAKFTLQLMKGFARHRKPDVSFGLDQLKSENPYERNAAIVAYGPTLELDKLYLMLANGPDLKVARDEICRAIEPSLQGSFVIAYKLCRDPTKLTRVSKAFSREERDVARVGFIVGRAHILQSVRNGGKISLLSEPAGWELGE